MPSGKSNALGVNDIFSYAMFIEARGLDDVTSEQLDSQQTVLLVDFTVNTGKSVVQFIHPIRSLCDARRIMVIAGIVQSDSVSEGGLIRTLSRDDYIRLIALRLPDHKFTGQGSTDTGNRLVNTARSP